MGRNGTKHDVDMSDPKRVIPTGGGSRYSSVEKASKEQVQRDIEAAEKRRLAKKKAGAAKRAKKK